jgi:hypothetical protein
MAKVRHKRSADAVEVPLPLLVDQPAALAAHDEWIIAREMAVKDRRIRESMGQASARIERRM